MSQTQTFIRLVWVIAEYICDEAQRQLQNRWQEGKDTVSIKEHPQNVTSLYTKGGNKACYHADEVLFGFLHIK